jgi:hypothetical protein
VRRRLWLFLAAILLGWIYLYAFALAAGLAALRTPPKWWLRMDLFSRVNTSWLVWLALAHAAATTTVSLPFAWIIRRVYGRLGAPLALAITAAICAFIEIPAMSQHFRGAQSLLQGIWLFEVTFLLAALPVSVWAFQASPSHNHSRPP